MPDCFCVPDAGARCSSARAATEATAIPEHADDPTRHYLRHSFACKRHDP